MQAQILPMLIGYLISGSLEPHFKFKSPFYNSASNYSAPL